MSFDIRALLDAMQARCDAAPTTPWRYREAAFGDPANGPDHTVLEALHPEQGWSSIARGDHDAWSGYGLGFAAASRSDLPRLIAAVRAVLELHRRVSIYDECECTDEQKAAGGHKDIYEVGTTCNRLYDICGECCRDDVYQREDCAEYHEHTIDGDYCPTVTALTAALDADS